MRRFLHQFKTVVAAGFFCGFAHTGMSQAAVIIQDINPGAANSSPTLFTFCGGLNCVFFVAGNSGTGSELWKYDLTTKTATLVKDINPGAAGSGITSITTNFAGNGIIFNANDGTNGNELWKSDGTSLGTLLAVDINPGAGSSNPANFYPYGGTFICSADNGTNGKEPWLTNGNVAGTAMLKDINPGSGASDPNNFTAIPGKLMFRANDGTNGSELWSTDMTSGGTVLVKDINPGANPSVPQNFAVLGNELIFSAMDAANGAELWKSDGTTGGTILVKDINAGAGNSINVSPGSKAYFTAYGSAVYFQATNGSSGYELWKTDGTSGGTTLVKDIQSGSGSSNPTGLLSTATNLFFFANDGTTGMELWMSDGTTGGTALLKDINPGAASSTGTTSTFVKAGSGPIYFSANDGTNGDEFWRTLGSAGSTAMMADINSGSGSSSPANMLVVGNNVCFSANDGTAGIEPWNFDPTAAGIHEQKANELDITLYPNPSNGNLFIKSSENNLSMRIFSLTGEEVYANTFTNSNSIHAIQLKDLSSGVYLVRVSSGQRETVRKLFLSQ